jgi:glyoxylase-like metal-dependent hydrolase (beta-lactamase superfamily II)
MNRTCVLAVTLWLAAATAEAQSNPMLPETPPAKVSDHVWAIMGFPNVIIVAGASATLVVDTGLGAKNGAIVMRQVEKIAKNPKLFLATTHFHPEHAGGEQGFPASTILLRNSVQQREMDQHGMEMIDMFRGFSAQNKELLAGVKFRAPDVVFDSEAKLDLGGGVTARLIWTGGGHTEGDLMAFVEPDRTLISGDIVEKNQMPAIFGTASSMTRWLASLDKLLALNARYVAPDHGELGDGSLVAKQKTFMTELRDRALEGKRQGKTVEDTAAAMLAAMKPKYPDYNLNANNMTNVAKKVWSEN